MFDLSLIELLFIAVVALLVVGPQDLPKVLAQCLRVFRQFKSAVADVKSQIDEVIDESGVREAKEDIQTIIDDNGQIQRVYDISDFLDETSGHPAGGKAAAQDLGDSVQSQSDSQNDGIK